MINKLINVKNMIIPCGILLAVILTTAFMKPKQTNNCFRISICKAIEHDALNSVANGIMDYLSKYKDVVYDTYTCQANQATASQIASKVAGEDSPVFVAIGTLPALASFSMAKNGNLKLVFSSVTNPSDISNSFAGSNATGVSNFVQLRPQIELFREIQPNLKKLGIIYNSGESNSVAIVEKLRVVLKEMGIELVEQSIQRSSDIPQAVNSIVTRVDAVFISNDNTVLAGISFVIKVCTANKVPVYVSDTDQVEKGCLASLGPNQYDIGVQTGKIIEKVKNGADINSIAVEYPVKTELFVNIDAASAIGIIIPDSVLTRAEKVIAKNTRGVDASNTQSVRVQGMSSKAQGMGASNTQKVGVSNTQGTDTSANKQEGVGS
ncbi:MAG: ABC transporter substrate-binding protein [Holosporales bacterium]|jgi:putative ABC transport system substrate-binding protein|nr:ABC transporter substrate-binding protein [Holosporales bacterium]